MEKDMELYQHLQKLFRLDKTIKSAANKIHSKDVSITSDDLLHDTYILFTEKEILDRMEPYSKSYIRTVVLNFLKNKTRELFAKKKEYREQIKTTEYINPLPDIIDFIDGNG